MCKNILYDYKSIKYKEFRETEHNQSKDLKNLKQKKKTNVHTKF